MTATTEGLLSHFHERIGPPCGDGFGHLLARCIV